MKTYTKLPLPQDSAWDRKTWRSYTPIWLLQIIDGLTNIIRWIPVIYKDRDWDETYILRMLQKKIEHQRAYLVKANRHTRIDEDNFWMTITLNLIERELQEFYNLEQYDYMDTEVKFVPCEKREGSYEMKTKIKRDRLDEYFMKYKGAITRVMKANRGVEFIEKEKLAFHIARYNQARSRRLLFLILMEHSNRWWD